MDAFPKSGVLVEAEAFDDLGGWVVDSQFEMVMGSPYILAHGNGSPVADATTVINIIDADTYNVWVRAKDWIPGHHPGRFTLSVNGTTLETEFGANDQDWNWQLGGRVKLVAGDVRLALRDLTGFCGRCDAIFFSRDDTTPPETVDEAARSWRRRLHGLPENPVDGGTFDVVVVGGGVPGTAAALTAARLGERVALVQDRPYLGGNASVEIGLSPRGVNGPLIKEISRRHPGGDLYGLKLLKAEPNATVFLEHTVYDAITVDNTIVSIDARDARSGCEIRISAPVFVDCSGKTILGLYSGAETLFGQESKAEYGESLAPVNRDDSHHGNTVFFRTRMADSPTPFPSVPWATEVAKDFADLGGQLKRPGIENGAGPKVISPGHVPDPSVAKRMTRPFTHFWEYGQLLDPYVHGEHIRDHLLRAIYGTFSNVKTMDPETYANLALDWVAFVPAQGEFRRYKGDYVLTETDIRAHKQFPDAVVKNGGAFCLHYAGNEKYDFRLKHWEWDERDGKPYDIPFRCLYSANISNLMMAGKHLSVTHVAGSNTKFMGNGGQHAIATAAAAHLCNKHRTNPRGVYENYMDDLRSIVLGITGANSYKSPSHL
ncbi:FAD dependent oxidoreductase-domain-containing protein [Ilyonectria sp. MPI-CAGE-AT-0026]|nr:FAD dependent oxidoreductase-domain-containing protein [Ilyonectria sp. MPI-CAGE-AT-0026]